VCVSSVCVVAKKKLLAMLLLSTCKQIIKYMMGREIIMENYCRKRSTLVQAISPKSIVIAATMTSFRPMCCNDLFKFNHINLDPLTETYNVSFYLQYLSTWPGYCSTFEDPSGRLMGYILGKAEGNEDLWHGHVTAVTVSPEFRRLGVAKKLMSELEEISKTVYNAYFVDLFVRASNALAIQMYHNMGYIVYRRVLGYYAGSDEEDAFGKTFTKILASVKCNCLYITDMRKALPRDETGKSIIPLTHPITPDQLEW
jgi:N-terminal acetyltransferase B complex catalytic subunit